jgi:hypothetical protein
MLTKLTLTIEKNVIDQAKRYAKQRNKSVSKLVEDFLGNVAKGTDQLNTGIGKDAPITNTLIGMFQSEYQGQEYRDLLEEALMERHL